MVLKKYLEEKKIILYSTYSQEIKSALTERTISMLKGKLYRYLTLKNTLKYIDVLPDIVNAYNEGIHRSHRTPEH